MTDHIIDVDTDFAAGGTRMKRKDFIEIFSKKDYLGDGLYVHFDGYHFILSCERYDQRDPIWDIVGLEPEVFDNLIEYREKVYEAAKNLED